MASYYGKQHGVNRLGGPGNQELLAAPDTTQRYPLGERLELHDGRVYRYAHFTAAANRATLVAPDVSTAYIRVQQPAGANKKITSDYAAGVTQISLTDTDAIDTSDALDAYAGGFFQVVDDAGEGYQYKIKGNSAGTAAGVMTVDLEDATVMSINTESSWAIIGTPYRHLRLATTTDYNVAGVAVRTMAVGQYGWIQTWGVGIVLADETAGTIADGTIATLSNGTAGAAQPMGGAALNSEDAYDLFNLVQHPIVGYFMDDAANAEQVAVYLQIAP